MAENLSVHQHPNGKYGVFDKSTLQPVQPKFSFEKDMYDSQDEANQAVQQRMQAGYQMQPGLGGLGGSPLIGQAPPANQLQRMPAMGPSPQMPGSMPSGGPKMTPQRQMGGLNPMNGPGQRPMPNLGPDLSMMPGVM